jgi:hypothetical protein
MMQHEHYVMNILSAMLDNSAAGTARMQGTPDHSNSVAKPWTVFPSLLSRAPHHVLIV